MYPEANNAFLFITMGLQPWLIMLFSFVAAIILALITIPILRRVKAGQSIRQIGPDWHNSKAGTPTIGGVIFIFAMLIATIVVGMIFGWWRYPTDIFGGGQPMFDVRFWAIMLCSLAFGVIGFIDDFIKVVLKRNLGLKAKQKFVLQFIVSLAFAVWIVMSGVIDTTIIIPFVNASVELGWLFIPFTVFVMIGVTNSVNLTDGLDGLATSVTIVVLLFFAAVSPPDGWYLGVSSFAGERLASLGLIGGLLGFLLFNKNPAKVFMGDTGSLFLGGAVVSIAIMLQMPLFLIIVGFVYLAETLSVIIQVISFKTLGRRVFKMSPLHHHFEMVGWSERKVVLTFTLVTVVLCVGMYLVIR